MRARLGHGFEISCVPLIGFTCPGRIARLARHVRAAPPTRTMCPSDLWNRRFSKRRRRSKPARLPVGTTGADVSSAHQCVEQTGTGHQRHDPAESKHAIAGSRPRRQSTLEHEEAARTALRHPDGAERKRRHVRHADDGRIALARDIGATRRCVLTRRLREAGAIFVGKTNMHEFAFGITTISSLGGQTLNPCDLTQQSRRLERRHRRRHQHANFATVGMGGDTCGSIRIPSSHNSLTGLRVTQNLFSRDGIIPLSLTAGDIGWAARARRHRSRGRARRHGRLRPQTIRRTASEHRPSHLRATADFPANGQAARARASA